LVTEQGYEVLTLSPGCLPIPDFVARPATASLNTAIV
jgi:hypothetical protein